MAPHDRVPRSPTEHPDDLTADRLRRFQLWRAMTDLAAAQTDGRLTEEQARLLESLADTLQQLSTQLSQLAELGQQCIQVLDPERNARKPLRGNANEG